MDSRIKQVKTKDGSVTYHDSSFDETLHSLSGALTEADKKYAEVCRIGSRETVDILDVCFGLGYNTAAAIDCFSGARMNVVGLESYQGIIDEIVRLGAEYPFMCREMMQKLAADGKYDDGRFSIRLDMGDARETILKLTDNSFDVVFFDPFSPAKCPELWTKELFSQVHRVMRKGGVLATYSCARVVRENMKTAGFTVSDGPVVGRRGPGTIARRS